MSNAQLILLCLVIPLAGSLGVLLLRSQENLRESASIVSGLLLLCVVLVLLQRVLDAQTPELTVLTVFDGVDIAFSIEPLGMIFMLVAGSLWVVTTVYAIGYMRSHHEANQTRFYFFFAIAIASTMGIAMSANLFTLFVFYETLTLCTYPLVTHSGNEDAKRSGRIYFGILIGTSIGLLLPAILMTAWLADGLEFRAGGILKDITPFTSGLLLLLYVFGIGKAAIMPIHRWLPAAMVAPTPVSALLHAVAVVKAGVFCVLKISVYVFGIDTLANIPLHVWLAYLAAFTILGASFVAMRKDNLKARLAYSTVSQLSYIILAAMLATPLGIVGGASHIAMHAFGKITLFFCAGAIMVTAHKTEVSQLRGLGRRMPFTMGAFLIGSLCIVGLPPTGGVWSKWLLAIGTLDAELWPLLAVLMLSSLLSLSYLVSIPVQAFFSRGKGEQAGIAEAPWPCLLAIGITTIGCVVLFFYPGPVLELARSLV